MPCSPSGLLQERPVSGRGADVSLGVSRRGSHRCPGVARLMGGSRPQGPGPCSSQWGRECFFLRLVSLGLGAQDLCVPWPVLRGYTCGEMPWDKDIPHHQKRESGNWWDGRHRDSVRDLALCCGYEDATFGWETLIVPDAGNPSLLVLQLWVSMSCFIIKGLFPGGP